MNTISSIKEFPISDPDEYPEIITPTEIPKNDPVEAPIKTPQEIPVETPVITPKL